MSEHQVLELDMNLEEYEDYEPLPAGNYAAEIRSAEMRISDKGNEYFYVSLNIHPDEFPVDYDVANAPEGAMLVYARLQKPTPDNRRSITAIKNFYRAMGMKLKTNVINPGEWEGKKVSVNLGQSEYQGEMRNDIRGVEALD